MNDIASSASKITHEMFRKRTVYSEENEIYDRKFFCVNMVLAELVTVDNGDFCDYLALYECLEVDVSSPSLIREARTEFDSNKSIGVIMIPGDNKKFSDALFAEVFKVAMSSGLAGARDFYENYAAEPTSA